MAEENEIKMLNPKDVSYYISNKGPLASIFPSFEERPTQIDLLEKICKAFNEDKIAAFEAGTGVGKSFAYLIPAMLWSIENKERIVISTGTINLQQQLYEKDIPLAQKLIGKEIKAVLVKGRQNFVCLRRFNEALKEQDMFSEQEEELETIQKWLAKTQTGSNSDLSFLPNPALWQKINSESDACMGQRCRHHEHCFVMKIRKEAADANLLIVNHHLLFADIEMRLGVGFDEPAVLPPYQRLIFDEAHGIEDAATSFFSEGFTRFAFLKQLNRIYRTQNKSISGYLHTLELLSNAGHLKEQAIQEIDEIKLNISKAEDSALEILDNFYTWRLTENTVHQATGLFSKLTDLSKSITKFIATMKDLIDEIDQDDQTAPVVWETKNSLARLDGLAILCKNFNKWQQKDQTVFWLEKSGGGSREAYPRFLQTPIDIAPLMKTGVFENLKTVACVSATLTTANKFDFWLKRCGINLVDKNRVISGEFSSPFDYKNNTLFSIPVDIPLPNENMFQQAIEEAIVKLIRASSGRCLVLFTSYESLRSACEYARKSLSFDGITVYKQGDDDRFRLLQSFKENIESVLFATDSFWEGVDVPGESLSHVILVKLPFAVPSDPVFAARSDAIEKTGSSSFMELSLPQAIITFRQGFGRLIRHSEDFGAVTVLDKRLIAKRYGQLFIESIPEVRTCFEPLNDVCTRIKKLF